VGRELPVRAADPHPDERPRDPAVRQHLRERHRPDQALRAEYPKTSGANDGQSQSPSLG
jgi:hypothetical protein